MLRRWRAPTSRETSVSLLKSPSLEDVTYAVLFVKDEVFSCYWLIVALDLNIGLEEHLKEPLLKLFNSLVLVS